jgi:hypothetical protein
LPDGGCIIVPNASRMDVVQRPSGMTPGLGAARRHGGPLRHGPASIHDRLCKRKGDPRRFRKRTITKSGTDNWDLLLSSRRKWVRQGRDARDRMHNQVIGPRGGTWGTSWRPWTQRHNSHFFTSIGSISGTSAACRECTNPLSGVTVDSRSFVVSPVDHTHLESIENWYSPKLVFRLDLTTDR